ncbi:MAG: MoaD/ThiS family protein [Actinomycetota bacterium]
MTQVRLFAVLRELAGSSEVQADGDTVEQVVQQLCDRFGERFTAIAERSSVVVDGERASLDVELAGGEEVAILPPVSGG